MAKETTKDAKNSTEQEKILVNDITDKGLISKIYTQLIQLTTTTTTTTTKIQSKKKKKRAEDINRHVSQEDIQMAKRHVKRCSTPLIFREMQTRTTIRYHLTPVRMAMIKKSVNNKRWRRHGGKGASFAAAGDVNWSSHHRQHMGVSQSTKSRITIRFIQGSPTPGCISRQNDNSRRSTHPSVHSDAVHERQDEKATYRPVNR